jgi:hypothetical protein
MVEICGRKVKVQTGSKSQTVNICSPDNVNGQYDYIVRLKPPFIAIEALLARKFNSIEDLVRWLERDHRGELQRRPRLRAAGPARLGSNRLCATEEGFHALSEFFRSANFERFSLSSAAVMALSEEDVVRIFDRQSKAAPYRGLSRPYFVSHNGKTTSGLTTNRREEHLAIALWHAYRKSGFTLPDQTTLFPVDYQLPLKSARDAANATLGKVDLFCADTEGAPWITEIKIRSDRSRGVEPPLRALFEALAYCGTLDPDMRTLSRESDDKKRELLHTVSPLRPNLLILAPAEYWEACDVECGPDDWRRALKAGRDLVHRAIKIRVCFVRMDNCQWEMTESGEPHLTLSPIFSWAIPEPALQAPSD